MKAIHEWELDLERVRAGELCFDVFAERHAGVIRRLSGKYAGAAMELGDADQEIRIAVWRAIDSYDCERGVSLAGHVGYRVRMHVLNLLRALRKRHRGELLIAESAPSDANGALAVAPLPDVLVDAMRRYHRVLGTLGSDDAQVVMMIADGQSVERIMKTRYRQCGYWGAMKRVHRALHQASALASEI